LITLQVAELLIRLLLQAIVVVPATMGTMTVRTCKVLVDHTLRVMDMENAHKDLTPCQEATGQDPSKMGFSCQEVREMGTEFWNWSKLFALIIGTPRVERAVKLASKKILRMVMGLVELGT